MIPNSNKEDELIRGIRDRGDLYEEALRRSYGYRLSQEEILKKRVMFEEILYSQVISNSPDNKP